MPQSIQERRRARHEAKRKAKRKTVRGRLSSRSKKALLRAALAWPVMECWINAEWKDPMQLNQIAVTRRNPTTGEVYMGSFLVDRACLGVKDAYAANFRDAGAFRREFLTQLKRHQKLIKIDFNLAAKIVKAGVDYAAQFGFHPHRDYQEASILLQDADPDSVDIEIPVGGPEGKPFFVAGPYDNVDKIMARLMQQLGPDGFNYLMPMAPDSEFFRPEDVMLDWDEDEDDVLDVGDFEFVEPPDGDR